MFAQLFEVCGVGFELVGYPFEPSGSGVTLSGKYGVMNDTLGQIEMFAEFAQARSRGVEFAEFGVPGYMVGREESAVQNLAVDVRFGFPGIDHERVSALQQSVFVHHASARGVNDERSGLAS